MFDKKHFIRTSDLLFNCVRISNITPILVTVSESLDGGGGSGIHYSLKI